MRSIWHMPSKQEHLIHESLPVILLVISIRLGSTGWKHVKALPSAECSPITLMQMQEDYQKLKASLVYVVMRSRLA